MDCFLLSDEQVDRYAAFDISESFDLYDPRFGIAGSTEVSCPTCHMRNDACLGHHASLSLGVSVFNPFAHKDIERILNTTCLGCSRLLPKVSKSKTRKCPDCETINHGDYRIQSKEPNVAVRQRGQLKPNEVGTLPSGYIVSKILVPPIYLRTPEDMEWSSDIHKMYEQLIQYIKKRDEHNICTTVMSICKVVMDILSGKDGIFRKLMMGKRVELSARAVVVGDPHLALDEVAVPKRIAAGIRMTTTCTAYDLEHTRDLAKQGVLWWPESDDRVSVENVLPGMKFERNLCDGDYVMLNRQPSLSRFSLMCFRTRLRKDDFEVIAINPQVTAPFNADFDGDEMNLFFLSNTQEARAEMRELCHVSQCPTTPVQDVVTGCYIMSKDPPLPVSDAVWNDCIALCTPKNMTNLGAPATALPQATGQTRNTKGLLSMYIPEYDGKLLRKKDLKELLTCQDTYRTLQLVVERWMSGYGLTVPFESVVTDRVQMYENEDVEHYKERCIKHVTEKMSDTDLMHMVESGAKGTPTHVSHMAVALGQQYVGGKEGTFCHNSYSRGLTPDEFFGHQMAAREGVVSTGISTATTGYLNRKACKIIADLKLQYNGTIADRYGVSSF